MKKNNTRKHAAVILVVIMLATAFCVQLAFAETLEEAKAGLQSGIMEIYEVIRIVAGAGGAIALAGCGLIMIYGNEKDAEKAKVAVKYILIAVAGVMLLPLAVRAGKNMFGSGWDPHSIG